MHVVTACPDRNHEDDLTSEHLGTLPLGLNSTLSPMKIEV
jgi:hypothetical protein